MTCHPVRDEGLDMFRQLRDRARAPIASELAERERGRHAAPNAPGAIALANQPQHVVFDLRSDPRTAKPIHRLRLVEVLLQHDNFLSPERIQEVTMTPAARYVSGGGGRSWRIPTLRGQSAKPAAPGHITEAGTERR
jgi:hypothetical protein